MLIFFGKFITELASCLVGDFFLFAVLDPEREQVT